MKKISVIGIDLAKAHFQIHANDAKGEKIFSKALTPKKSMALLANTPKCIVGMEACGGAHFYARKIKAMGHDVRIIPPQYVRGLVVGNHNDMKDGEAIAEAALSKRIHFVPIKTPEHQDLQSLHRIRERLIGNKVALTNQIRGLLYEYGIRIAKGDRHIGTAIAEARSDDSISQQFKDELSGLHEEFLGLLERIKTQDKKIENIAKADDTCKRLMGIPGIGPLVSTAVIANMVDPASFKNGRQFAASLGLVPGHRQTGGPTKKVMMLGITKRGDRYLRKLIIQGARGWLISAKKYDKKQNTWARKMMERKHFNNVAVAAANKNARMVWALLAHNEDYSVAKAA